MSLDEISPASRMPEITWSRAASSPTQMMMREESWTAWEREEATVALLGGREEAKEEALEAVRL